MRSLVPSLFSSLSLLLMFTAPGAAQEVDQALMREMLLGEFETEFVDCQVPADRVPNTLAMYTWRIGRGYFSGFESVEEDVAAEIAAAFWAESLASGALIEDETGVRLPQCPDGPEQQALRIERAADVLLDIDDARAMELFTEVMGLHGCRVPLSTQDRFAETGLRHVAGLFGVELPDPMPPDADAGLTRLLEITYDMLDDAGEDLIRAGALVVENDVATLAPCAATGPALRVEPDQAMSRIEALSTFEMAIQLGEEFASLGCQVPDSMIDGLHMHFIRTVLISVGVDLTIEDMRNYVMTRAGPAADYARAITYLHPRFQPLLRIMNDTAMLERQGDAWIAVACSAEDDPVDLQGYYP